MKKITLFLFAAVAMLFAACDYPDNPSTGTTTTPSTGGDGNPGLTGIAQLTSGIGNWDEAWVTPDGYFTYEEDMAPETATRAGGGRFSTLTWMNFSATQRVSVVMSKDTKIPVQIVTSTGVLYFSYLSESVLELVYDDGRAMTLQHSLAYDFDELASIATSRGFDRFKTMLSNTWRLFGDFMPAHDELRGFRDAAGRALDLSYEAESSVASRLGRGSNGNYNFANTLITWYTEVIIVKTYYTLSLWTGDASFKVGGSSCTLDGAIWCPVNTFNSLGTYGIVCDTDRNKLTVGNAEYEGTGYQGDEDKSFSVDFRGLKPNTTYYYRAYFKFNGSDHGNLKSQYNGQTAGTFYDNTIKSFNTGDNKLTVDVVMCIDATGSMSGVINTVKRNALGFYDAFNTACVNAGIELTGLNTQVVSFRDKNVDGAGWLHVSQTYVLPGQRTNFESFLNTYVYASGGGDTPESGLEALQTAFQKSDWGKDDGFHRQVIILWTDAPYLVGSRYTSLNAADLEKEWNKLPTGRRLILFAPDGSRSSNGGSWNVMDTWKNVIHVNDLRSGFSNFDYILQNIIGELTGRARVKTTTTEQPDYFFRSND